MTIQETTKKNRIIPKDRYLGVYFKSSDQDLIEWKKLADDAGGNMTEFAKGAIREKLKRDRAERSLEHPSVILKRIEVQQSQLFAMIQQIIRALQGQIITGIPDVADVSVGTILVENTLDQRCAEAGWE